MTYDRTRQQSSLQRQEVMESSDVCADSVSLFRSFSLWSPPTVIRVAGGLSDDLEISLLSERGGGSLADICHLTLLFETWGGVWLCL